MRPSSGVPYVPPESILRIAFSPPALDQQERIVATLGRIHQLLDHIHDRRNRGRQLLDTLFARAVDAAVWA
jgi:hypothetical protein